MADAFALARMRALHLDLDSFFLAVHKRRDPTLPLDSKPVVLYQFQDVICANRRAKALGVQKHMRPREARALVEPHGGLVMHAFCRDWPGPRVRYGPYNAASREFFDALADALTATGGGAAIERGSIDEAFVELAKAAGPGGLLRPTPRRRRRRDGPARHRRLRSEQAARQAGVERRQGHGRGGAGRRRRRGGRPAPRRVAGVPPAGPEPASGGREDDFRPPRLRRTRRQAARQGLWAGRRDAQVRAAQDGQVASWTAHTRHGDALPPRRGAAVAFPSRRGESWVFEPHDAEGSSERTRPRWVVLACVEIKFTNRAFVRPRHRRDACSTAWRCRFLTARRSQRGHVIAEK